MASFQSAVGPAPMPRRRVASRRARVAVVAAVATGTVALVFAAGAVALVLAAGASHAGLASRSSTTLRPPLAEFSAARLFDRPNSAWGPGHRGVDLEALAGDVVRAPADGLVTFAGVVVDRGVVTVDHGGTLRSSVEPITPLVHVGDRVRAGDPLGVVSEEPRHCAPATCLHWGVRRGDAYVNPLDVLVGYGPIVLLP